MKVGEVLVSSIEIDDTYLSHHGMKGQKWGLRRYQNPDGTLTPEGRIRYSKKNAGIEFDEHGNLTESSKIVAMKSAKKMRELEAYFSDADLTKAYNRLNTSKNIATIQEWEANEGKRKADQILGKIETGAKLYNIGARINNAFNPKFELPTIDLNSVSKSAKKRAEDAIREAANKATGNNDKAADKKAQKTIKEDTKAQVQIQKTQNKRADNIEKAQAKVNDIAKKMQSNSKNLDYEKLTQEYDAALKELNELRKKSGK